MDSLEESYGYELLFAATARIARVGISSSVKHTRLKLVNREIINYRNARARAALYISVFSRGLQRHCNTTRCQRHGECTLASISAASVLCRPSTGSVATNATTAIVALNIFNCSATRVRARAMANALQTSTNNISQYCFPVE